MQTNFKTFIAFAFGCVILILFFSCTTNSFEAIQSEDGILIQENRQNILFYQTAPKDRNGTYKRSNYIHPLYDLDGDTITQDFPEDHPTVHYHQRGVCWAWNQVYAEGKRMGNQWKCEDFNWEVLNVEIDKTPKDKMIITTYVHWKSPHLLTADGKEKPFVLETNKISIHSTRQDYRAIDFEIKLLALTDSVLIGGSDDIKGYGGFKARFKMPDDLTFVSMDTSVISQNTAIPAGPWMDFSGTLQQNGKKSGIAIFCDTTLSTFTGQWILRRKKSMQNPVYPGRTPVSISQAEPMLFQYRLIIHRGTYDHINLNELYHDWQ